MTKLSVNINKIAVVRNSRGGNLPDVVRAALDCERFGAQTKIRILVNNAFRCSFAMRWKNRKARNIP